MRFGGLYAEEGHPDIPIQFMVGLHLPQTCLQRIGCSRCSRWAENRYWQYFCDAPEVECISKGKALKPYELDVKVGG